MKKEKLIKATIFGIVTIGLVVGFMLTKDQTWMWSFVAFLFGWNINEFFKN